MPLIVHDEQIGEDWRRFEWTFRLPDDFPLGINRELQCPVNIHTCRIANVQLRPLVDSRQMRRTRVWELFFQFKRYYGDERVAMIFPVSDMGDFVIHDDVSIPPQPGVNTIVRRARTPSKVLHVLPFKAFVSGLKEIWSPEGL